MNTLDLVAGEIAARALQEIGIVPSIEVKNDSLFYSFLKGCCNTKDRVLPTMDQVNQFKDIVREEANDPEYEEYREQILGNVGE